ncbi:MAG TPA: hypothetical protein VLT16_00530 [Candidatus Limnocylindrales bacterium]|nr:hypothetical protein [Candidatus Limnocylindrales bacterium]
MQFVKPMPFDEAVQKLGDKTPIGSALLSAEWQDVPVALRERALFSSQVENVRFLQRAQGALDDFLTSSREDLGDGVTALKTGSRAQFIEQMREFALSEGMGPIDESMAGGLRDITSERRLGLIFDTQTRQANDYGYWRQGMNADVLDEFPAQRFIRVQDVKQERDSHKKFENQVYLKSDPIWADVINEDFHVPWGPWAWGCGHDVEDVDRDEAESLGLLQPGDQVEPDTRNFNENLQASTAGLEPELVQKLQDEFGDQLVVEGDTMRWRGGSSASPSAEVNVGFENPVSDALEVKLTGSTREEAQAAIAAIDKVHDDGKLPQIPVKTLRGLSNGVFVSSADGKAKEIQVRPNSSWPGLSTAHEIGHFLDLEAIGEKGKFATRSGDAGMKEVLKAAEETDAIKGLRRRLKDSESPRVRHYVNYLLGDVEIWARAYAQFIGEESGSKLLEQQLEKAIGVESGRQWSHEDFKPVSAAIKKMFQDLGWM